MIDDTLDRTCPTCGLVFADAFQRWYHETERHERAMED